MVKNYIICTLVLIIALMLTLSCGAAGSVSDQMIYVGQNGIYDLNSAVNALRENAGNAVIYLNGSVNMNQPVNLPENLKGLKSLTLASLTGAQMTVNMGQSLICANGVPFTVDQGVTLSNGFVIGGKCSYQPGTVSVDESVIVIDGTADYVIGGGFSAGYGVISTVKNSNIVINGTANVIHGGGYAYNGGVADISGTANVILTRRSTVKTAAYGGGYAGGSGSNAPVAAVHLISLGTAGKISRNAGLTYEGGKAAVGAYTIELLNPKTPPTAVPSTTYNNGYPYSGNQTYPINTVNTTVIYIGPNQQAQNFTDAVNLLPTANTGNVEFRITGNFNQKDDVVIPRNRGILSVTVTGNNNARMTVYWPEDVGFFANGIPLSITNSVVFSSGTIYGGADAGVGEQSNLQTTYLDIAGTVNKVVAGSKAKGSASAAHVTNTTLIFRGKANGWLYGGGAALYGGYSAVDGTAELHLMQGATVEQSVSGGGYTFGPGSQTVVKDAYIDVAGSVIYAVFLGGYADQSSSSYTTGQAYLNLQSTGNVGQSVWYGGRAYKNSSVYVDTAMAQISGRVGASVHKEGRGSDGGTVSVRFIR